MVLSGLPYPPKHADEQIENIFKCYALSIGNEEFSDQTKKCKVCTGMDSDNKTNIITSIKCKIANGTNPTLFEAHDGGVMKAHG